MAKSQLFQPPVLDFIINHGGTFRCAAGIDEEAFITAHLHLRPGGTVLMGTPRAGASARRRWASRSRASARLALESGVPVVPIVIHGSEQRA